MPTIVQCFKFVLVSLVLALAVSVHADDATKYSEQENKPPEISQTSGVQLELASTYPSILDIPNEGRKCGVYGPTCSDNQTCCQTGSNGMCCNSDQSCYSDGICR